MDGGIKVGSNVVIDGFDRVKYRVVTHIHADHTQMLTKSVNINSRILGTPLTIEWLKALGKLPSNASISSLEYGKRIKINEITLALEKAHHIPGASQVRFRLDDEGIDVVYTSDFKKPGTETPILKSDLLIIDAVYGKPQYVRDFDEYIEEVLADLIKELLSRGPVYVYGYYGKIQEVMMLLRTYGIDAPFIVPLKHYKLCKVAEKFGLFFGDLILAGTDEATDIMRDGWYVYFSSMGKRVNGLGNHVILSGWEFSKPFKRLNSKVWLVAFSDHADFKGLVEYVRLSNARNVIVNGVRSVGAQEFAEYIKKKFGINAYVMP